MSDSYKPGNASHKLLCVFLAVLIAFGPAASTLAQPPTAEADGVSLEYVVPGACAVVVLRPKQVLAAEVMRMLPLEVIQAAGLHHAGFDPLQIEQVVISASSPLAGPPTYSVYATSSEEIALKQGPATEHTIRAELNGQVYLQSQAPMAPSFFAPDGNSLLATPESALQTILGEGAAENPIAARASSASAGDDIYALVDLEALRPLIGMALTQIPPDFPAEARPLLQIPQLLKSVELTLNISNTSISELVVHANSPADAEQVETILDGMKELVLAAMQAEFEKENEPQRMLESEDPVEQAMGRYLMRMQEEMANSIRDFRMSREGATFTLIQIDPEQAGFNQATYIAGIGILVALLLPAVQAAREAARRASAMNNMKQIMLAMHNYAAVHRSFPAQANYADDGAPLLSWRVHLLPYLEHQTLYEQFHLDEPWDSEHNKTLIPLMPSVYVEPSSHLDPTEGRTQFLGVKGEGMFLSGKNEGLSLRAIRDGTANTMAILQVNNERASVWTKPDDWELDEKNVLKGLGGPHPGIFLAGFCDGHIESINEDVAPDTFKALLTIAGGEVVSGR